MTDAAPEQRTGTRKPPSTATHSFRIPNDTWDRARARAEREGIKLNRVAIELLEGYARGVYQLPKRRIIEEREYPAVASSSEAATPDGPAPGAEEA